MSDVNFWFCKFIRNLLFPLISHYNWEKKDFQDTWHVLHVLIMASEYAIVRKHKALFKKILKI